jgi:hypothetical protein
MFAPLFWIGFTFTLYYCSISRYSAIRIIGVPLSFAGMMVGMLFTLKWYLLGI